MATQGMNLASSGLTFTTETTERVIITDTGKLGLGVLSPTAMLHVVPTGSTKTIRLESLTASSSNTNFLVADSDGYVQTRDDIVTGTVNAITGITYSDWGLTSNGTGTYSGSPELPFITGGTYSTGTITLNINGGLENNISISGLQVGDMSSWDIGSTTGTDQTVSNGEVVDIVGGTGISGEIGGTRTVTLTLEDTLVTAAAYGDANTVGTFTVDAQGRLTAATDVDINITASQVSDFSATTLNDIFNTSSNNFVDTSGASGIDFTVIDGTSVSAVLQNSTISTSGTTGTGTMTLGGQLGFASSGNTINVVDNGSGLFDLEVDSSYIGNIYTTDGALAGNREVAMASYDLHFTGGDFKIGGGSSSEVIIYNNTNTNFLIGTGATATDAKLDVYSTTQGFLFPRMTQAQRAAMGTATTGMMVYQTDNREGVYIYKSFGWVQVI